MQDDLCHLYGGVAMGVAEWRVRHPRAYGDSAWFWLLKPWDRSKEKCTYFIAFERSELDRKSSIISLVYSCRVTWILINLRWRWLGGLTVRCMRQNIIIIMGGRFNLTMRVRYGGCVIGHAHCNYTKKKSVGRRNNAPADSPETYYRRNVLLPFLDHMLTQLQDRFGGVSNRL